MLPGSARSPACAGAISSVEGLATKRGKEQTWAQLVMAANTPMLLRAGLVEGDTHAGVLASGQVVGLLDDLPSCRELIEGVVAEAERILTALPAAVSPARR